MRLSVRRFLAVATLGAVALVASGGAPAEPMPTPTPTPSYTSTYETPAPVVYAPLTGLPVEDPASLAHSSLAAKIDNDWDARPPEGLEQDRKNGVYGQS